MYSEQELTKIIKEVSEAYIDELIEDGIFDEDIADYVDAYLVEHPVDITALEGQTIAPAQVNATTGVSAPSGTFTSINGESNPSVKPIYCHPLSIRGSTSPLYCRLSCLIFNNSNTAFNRSSFKDFMDALNESTEGTGKIMVSGGYTIVGSPTVTIIASFVSKNSSGKYVISGVDVDSGENKQFAYDTYGELFDSAVTFEDGPNKIN